MISLIFSLLLLPPRIGLADCDEGEESAVDDDVSAIELVLAESGDCFLKKK